MDETSYNHKREFSNWETVFREVDAVQIILYLRKHNPNIDTSNITKNLLMKESRVIEILHGLMHLNAVKFSDDTRNWALTNRGQNVADCLTEYK